ncbi:hypothetical protein [Streptomyces calidiresistens]
MTEPTTPLTETEAAREAARLIADAYRPTTPAVVPTSYRDTTPLPPIGATPPVPQPEHRTVPAWASGIAVASIGIGAGATGLGCGAWLVLHGLSAITIWGVAAIAAPFIGVAAAAAAIGAVLSRIRAAGAATHVHADAIHHTEIHTRAVIARNRITGP